MISKEYFLLLIKNEHKGLNRDRLYKVYEYLMTIPELRDNFYFNSDRLVWNNSKNHLTKYKINGMIESERFWKILNFEERFIDLKELSKYCEGTKDSLINYVRIVLNYMIPKTDKYIKEFKTEVKNLYKNKEINNKQEDNLGGIYGIYEDNQLVYIGMTMRNFEERWEEHKQRIKNKSDKLTFYTLIDTKKKIEFKKILEIEKMKSNSRITKRDLQAMEFALIQEHKPKYNFAGRTQPYVF